TLKNIGGYLAVDMAAGLHKYTFSFKPVSFFVGLWISLFASGFTLFLIISEIKFNRHQVTRNLRSLPSRFYALLARIKTKYYAGRFTRQAEYIDGTLVLEKPILLHPGHKVHISIDAQTALVTPRAFLRRWLWATADLLGSLISSVSPEIYLFSLSLIIYLLTRLWALEKVSRLFLWGRSCSDPVCTGFAHP
ncbi:MAG: hypothetical protein JSV61_09655, partial [Anaerolineales bacterium]